MKATVISLACTLTFSVVQQNKYTYYFSSPTKILSHEIIMMKIFLGSCTLHLYPKKQQQKNVNTDMKSTTLETEKMTQILLLAKIHA